MRGQQGSSFDPDLFDEVQQTIEEQLGTKASVPSDLESHILGETARTEDEKNQLNGQFCWEFVNHPLWSLYVQSLRKMVAREHTAFEKADSDPGDRLRANWKAVQKVVDEIIYHVESGARLYQNSQLK